MEKQRIEEIKQILQNSISSGNPTLDITTIGDLLQLLNNRFPSVSTVSKDTTPMIGNNPFPKGEKTETNGKVKDFNASLNYRIKKFGEE